MTININPNTPLFDGAVLRYNQDEGWFDLIPFATFGNVRVESSGVEGGIMVQGTSGHLIKGTSKKIESLAIYLPFVAYTNLSPMNTNASPYAVSVDRPTTFSKWTQSHFVLSTNNPSNYWTINLKTLGASLIASFNTASQPSNTWNQSAITSFSLPSVNTGHKGVYVEVVKVGSPGLLYLVAPLLEVNY